MDQPHCAHYGATSNVPLPIYYITPTPPPRRSKLGFIHAFLGAVGLLWLTHHLFHRHHWHRHRHWDWDWDIHMDIEGLDHDAHGCAVWDTYNSPSGHSHSINTTRSTYTLAIPLSSERFHFASWGPIDKSTFEVVPVESDEAQVVVEVDVVKDVYNGARVCALPSRGERETYGVGIYSPRRDQPYPSEDWPAFSIKVFVPLTKHQQHLGSFETRLGQFEHTFPDLSTINFSRLSVAAANVPMVFKDVVADTVSATNANGPISGKLTGATRVSIKTANAPIEGEVTLTGPGAVHASNVNSPMTLAIQLKSGDVYPRPDYHLELSNAKAPISARIASQPLNSGFFLKGSTVMGDMNVYLNAAFQGDFKLSNMFNPPIVELRNKQDPSGAGRERYLRFAKRGSTTTGSVQWGRGEHAPGNVDMSGVGGSIGLYLE